MPYNYDQTSEGTMKLFRSGCDGVNWITQELVGFNAGCFVNIKGRDLTVNHTRITDLLRGL